MLSTIASVSANQKSIVLLREPIGVPYRLTIKEHYSSDMDQIYNAIYRSEDELLSMTEKMLAAKGPNLTARGDVYVEADLNNRSDTRQRWFSFQN